MLLFLGSPKELPGAKSSARTLLKGTEMDCGLNFKLRIFPATDSGLLFDALPTFHAQTYTIWLLVILVPNFSPYNSFPHTHSLISDICQSFAKKLHWCSSIWEARVLFLTAFQMDASGLIVYHETHAALASPHSSLGTRFLCASVATEISPLNTSCQTQRPKPSETGSLTWGCYACFLLPKWIRFYTF